MGVNSMLFSGIIGNRSQMNLKLPYTYTINQLTKELATNFKLSI